MGTMTPAQRRALYESARFARETTYNGPLGPEYTPAGTRLQLWAPTAEQAAVNLYRKGHDSPCIGTLPLQRGPQGVWSIWLPGDQHGHYYTFTVTVDGVARETGDPYARSAGINGVRSMIVDLARTAPAGWERDVRPVIPPARRSVWEVSVRDFSQDAASGVRPAWRGKFLAFTQTGTTLHGDGIHPTCLNYLKRLGVGYVQLMPIFDFGSVDEAKPLLRQYNWGYAPTNYNFPEGSYSTDPARGEVRVRECKEMIAALHAAGIGVIMDVVYNHMYRYENVLNNTVPDYFFRQNEDGSLSNGSGCGNEFASERPMARRRQPTAPVRGQQGEPGHAERAHRHLLRRHPRRHQGRLFQCPGAGLCGGQARQLLGHRRRGGRLVPQRPSATPRPQPDRKLCVRPRQLHPVGQTALRALRAAGVHRI